MAAEDDPEKKFHSIMDKLFSSSPKFPHSNSNSRISRKRPNPESALALVEPINKADMSQRRLLSPSDAPLCRPWDRGDLMRRVSTFKSMTWFAKPKVASAVNCARRGWINLDMDTIGCEACGARLLFSTPSSWSHQQVEKAALVFSLKLDNGHKLLCPWIDNACDERLAEFPPMPPPVLVEKFRDRSCALLQLLALPLVSSSAVQYMRSAQLDEFLKQPVILDNGIESTQIIQLELIENECDDDSANLYYQAQKLISLCGWEPRSLPYVVEIKDKQKQVTMDANNLISSINESMESTDDCDPLSGLPADPQSTVLDCKLCGACVGLWAYSTVPRPLELLRVVGDMKVNGEKNSRLDSGNENIGENREASLNSASNGSSSIDRPSNLKLTIAGGPPPTKQVFKATISLPVIGRSLRVRLSYDPGFRNHTFSNQEPNSKPQDHNLVLGEQSTPGDRPAEQSSQPEAVEVSTSTSLDQGQCGSAGGDQFSCLHLENGEKGSAFRNESDIYISLEGMDFVVEGNFSEIGTQSCGVEGPTESTPDIAQGFGQSSIFPENLLNDDFLDSPVGSFGSSQLRISSLSDPGANVTTENGNNKQHNNSFSLVSSETYDRQEVAGANVTALKLNSRPDETHSDTQSPSTSQAENLVGIKGKAKNPANGENTACGTGKELRQKLSDRGMEFDPIRQHRHFCPWIVSTDSGAAGWQQTLSALFRQKEHSSPSTITPLSTSKIKVDDPIASVRRLFRSPSSTKRLKLTPRSS